jgi:hypothetical protein
MKRTKSQKKKPTKSQKKKPTKYQKKSRVVLAARETINADVINSWWEKKRLQ